MPKVVPNLDVLTPAPTHSTLHMMLSSALGELLDNSRNGTT